MQVTKNSDREKGLLPFEVIAAATTGDPEAVLKVIRNYEPYITLQAKRWFVKPNGESSYQVDQEIYDELIIKLIEAILSFKI